GIAQSILKRNGHPYRGSFHKIREDLPLITIDDAQEDRCACREQFARSIEEVHQNRRSKAFRLTHFLFYCILCHRPSLIEELLKQGIAEYAFGIQVFSDRAKLVI